MLHPVVIRALNIVHPLRDLSQRVDVVGTGRIKLAAMARGREGWSCGIFQRLPGRSSALGQAIPRQVWPGRSAHQAVAQAQQYIAEGHDWCVDFDLEKFFDRVNHDKLMGQIARRVEDKRLLKLIQAFLNAGVMENGLVSPSVELTPHVGVCL